MLRKLIFAASSSLFLPCSALADKPLAEAAAPFAGRLAAGCIVTGEKQGDRVAYAVAGKAEPDAVPPERRVFEIGSITKVFTGVLLAQAVIDKKVRLDSTLAELLGPDFRFADPNVGKITLVQLSTHTSGLPRLPENMGVNPDTTPDPYAAYDRRKMDAFLSKVKLEGPPPRKATYSNFAVGLLGEVLADAYGTTWEKLLAEKITTPLGMKDTMMMTGEEQRKRLAPPYHAARPGHEWNFRAIAAAGSLRSTAADLMIFGEAMVEPEKTPIAAAIQDMMQVHAEYPDSGGDIGLGIMIGRLDGNPDYMHTGATGGYRSALQVIPAKKTVRVVLINNDTIPAEAVLTKTRDEKKPFPVKEVPLTAMELDSLTGVYRSAPDTTFTVIRKGLTLYVRLTGQPFFPVHSIGDDRFRYAVVVADLQFNREAGRVASLTLFQNGREMRAKLEEGKAPYFLIPSPAELTPYRGDYELAFGKYITVTANGDTLFAKLTGQAAYPVFQTKPGYFEYDIVKAALEFQKDEAGKITGLVLHQNGSHPAKRK